MSPRQRQLMDTLGVRLALPSSDPIDPRAVFPQLGEVRLEIGFGAGDHLVAQAERSPKAGFIGVEFFTEGFGKALARIDDAQVDNIRLHQGDGREILARLPNASLTMVYVLFPDPWPKARHHKRRLIQADTVSEFARVLVSGGRLRVATDVKSYVDWALQHVRAYPALAWTARSAADWRTPPDDHVTTRYEAKNIGDCKPVFLDFQRVD